MEISAHLGCEEEGCPQSFFPPSHISIDYGILEETDLVVVQGDFGWDDLGSWSAL